MKAFKTLSRDITLPVKERVDLCLWFYVLLLVGLTAFAVGAFFLGGRSQLQAPLFDSSDRFADLTNYRGKISRLANGGAALGQGLPVFPYPAPAAYVYAFFFRGFPNHVVRAFLLTIIFAVLCGAVLLWRTAAEPDRNVRLALCTTILTTVFLGYPAVFVADRGNIEAIVALLLSTGLTFFVSRHFYLSAVFIGLAGSVKPFPTVFLLLFLARKRFRELMLGLVVGTSSVVLALTMLGPTPLAAYIGLSSGVKLFSASHILALLPLGETRFEHSIMDSLKMIFRNWAAQSQQHLKALLIVSVVIASISSALILIRLLKVPVINQVMMLSVFIALFPPVAADYTLVHLYFPFATFIIFIIKDVRTGHVPFRHRYIIVFLILFAVLFSPMTFIGQYSGVCKSVTLIMMLVAAGTLPMPSSIFKEP